MKFYTNIVQWGNSLLVREVENGERKNYRVKYSPTLYARVNKETAYKTLSGDYVSPIKHPTIKDAKKWLDNYKSQKNLIFGSTLYPYSYLKENYKDPCPWDKDQILIVTVDIEVQCENGFPHARLAQEELLSITIKINTIKRLLFG